MNTLENVAGVRRPGFHLGINSLALAVASSALILLMLSALAFWPRYLSSIGSAQSHIHAHAATGTAWLLLLVAQPVMIRTDRRDLHRVFGWIGLAIGIAFVITGVFSVHHNLVGMDAARFAQDAFFVYVPLAMTLIFAAALMLAVVWRASPAVHARFMACTLLPLLDPVIARILGMYFQPLPENFPYQLPAFAIMVAMLAVLVVTIPPRAPGRRSFVAFAIGSIAVFAMFFAVEGNATWMAFVEWFRSLPIG